MTPEQTQARYEALADKLESHLDRFTNLLVNMEKRTTRLERVCQGLLELMREEGAGQIPATLETEM